MSSHKYSLFTEKGYQLTKKYTVPRTHLGMGRYAAYKDFGESVWRIGYGSETIDDHYLDANDKASQEDIDKQFYEDLKEVLGSLGYAKSVIHNLWYQQYLEGDTHGWHIHGSHFTGVYYLSLIHI